MNQDAFKETVPIRSPCDLYRTNRKTLNGRVKDGRVRNTAADTIFGVGAQSYVSP